VFYVFSTQCAVCVDSVVLWDDGMNWTKRKKAGVTEWVLWQLTSWGLLWNNSLCVEFVSDFLTNMCSGTTPSCPPHLGIILYLLSTSSQQFAMTMDSYKQQHRKYTNLSDLSADEIRQVRSAPKLHLYCLSLLLTDVIRSAFERYIF